MIMTDLSKVDTIWTVSVIKPNFKYNSSTTLYI